MTARTKLRAEAIHLYNGRSILPGQIFVVPADDAASLVAMHVASVVEEDVPPDTTAVGPLRENLL